MTTTPLTFRTPEEPDMSDSTAPDTTTAPLVEAAGLTKKFGAVTALDGLDMTSNRCWTAW